VHDVSELTTLNDLSLRDDDLEDIGVELLEDIAVDNRVNANPDDKMSANCSPASSSLLDPLASAALLNSRRKSVSFAVCRLQVHNNKRT